jgi:hypothetical protein
MSNRIECPSEAWDRHCEDEDRAAFPNEEEMLERLDPMGDAASKYSVSLSIPGDDDYESDTTLYADFGVFEDEAGEIFIAYAVVYDGPGLTDTAESGVFELWELGELDKNSWFPIEGHVDGANEGAHDAELGAFIHWEDIEKAHKRWTKDLISKVKAVIKGENTHT